MSKKALMEKEMEEFILNSKKVGQIKYKESDLITLASPLLGFPDLHDFLLLEDDEYFPFLWFHSVEDPNVAFVVLPVKTYFNDYNPRIPKRELKVLQAKDISDLTFFGIVVVPENPKEATINLKAPLIINLSKKIAKQLILDDDRYEIKTPLFEG
ncbi:flagellar assembly protein FliW [Deferribacter desulfuricans SSM1]|uniref:Flagellar assembly factor FliW n=1 Tax=Deferribacter desulfuricans (strain DSM 14783 / JCM 11476 / NBRC 101012 / SSM1) TaxID=639282 RepID=D3PA50_DEFDS|nr:flagellar assembly protein FliW [Deferribacter desulfuricans]BAI81590.1 flagellar assembly protein FliW [Deferribacter desulfuricans SSM1]